jgi:hypothetical protein
MTAGHIYTIAGLGYNGPGDGGPATQAELVSPTGLAVQPSGAVLVADDNRIRLISPPGAAGAALMAAARWRT